MTGWCWVRVRLVLEIPKAEVEGRKSAHLAGSSFAGCISLDQLHLSSRTIKSHAFYSGQELPAIQAMDFVPAATDGEARCLHGHD